MLEDKCSTKAFHRVGSYIMTCAHEDVCVEGTTLWMRMLSSTHLDAGCPSKSSDTRQGPRGTAACKDKFIMT